VTSIFIRERRGIFGYRDTEETPKEAMRRLGRKWS
jgi:hypothetical protein